MVRWCRRLDPSLEAVTQVRRRSRTKATSRVPMGRPALADPYRSPSDGVLGTRPRADS